MPHRWIICFAMLLLTGPAAWPQAITERIEKVGTIDVGLVETAPVVFNDKLYRFESVRSKYAGNDTGKPYFRFVEVKTGKVSANFAQGYALGSAYVEDGKVYVYGTPGWGASSIDVFVSSDMKSWQRHQALDLPGWELFNTSVCKANGQYVMAFEVGGPAEVAGQRFTSHFAASDDLLKWERIPEPAVYSKKKYSACPTIRWSKGWYYMTYLNALGGYSFATEIVRSRDLATWEAPRKGLVLMFDGNDKKIVNDQLTPEQAKKIKKALNRNNSDLDFIEFEGRLVMYYSWGDQVGNEFLAKAIYDGPLAEFLESFFLDDDAKP